jgi:hypothetical protein
MHLVGERSTGRQGSSFASFSLKETCVWAGHCARPKRGSFARDAVGELAHDVEMPVVAGGRFDQVQQNPAQRAGFSAP